MTGTSRIFPCTRIGSKNTETEIEFTERGYRLAVSVNGTLTGRGGDLIIIDDPIKPDDALSEPLRKAVNNWYLNTLLSRLDNKATGQIVIVMQRVHVDDLTGLRSRRPGGLDRLEASRHCGRPLSELPPSAAFHTRMPGEVLWPRRDPPAVLEQYRLQLGSDIFAAQYPAGADAARRRHDQAPLGTALQHPPSPQRQARG